MKIVIQKYGGNPIATIEKIKTAAKHILATVKSGKKVVVVVSAMGDKTDELIQSANQIFKTGIPPQAYLEIEKLLVTGEAESSALMSMAIQAEGLEAVSLNGLQIGLETDSVQKKFIKRVKNIKKIKTLLDEGKIPVITGFQGVIEKTDEIITLGRGGSDLTAIVLAGLLKADCEVYKDVDGFYTIDPRLVPRARKFHQITYDQAINLSVAGSGVLMDRSLLLARSLGVKIKILMSPSIGKSSGGTLVCSRDGGGIERISSQAGIAVQRAILVNVYSSKMEIEKIFKAIAEINIIDVVYQPKQKVSIICKQDDFSSVINALKMAKFKANGNKIAILTLVDPLMKETSGYLYQVCRNRILAEKIKLISTATNSILIAVEEKFLKEAAMLLSKEFDLI